MQSTRVAMSKASRMPLNSKMANKDFYKGTGSYPGMGRKRQGVHSPRSKAPYLLQQDRMRYFVVPEIEADCKLKPFIARNVVPKHPPSFPRADTKPQADLFSRRNGLFSPAGFDGHYYLQLAKAARTEQERKANAGVVERLAERVQNMAPKS